MNLRPWYWYIPGVRQTKGVPFQGPYDTQNEAQQAADDYRRLNDIRESGK